MHQPSDESESASALSDVQPPLAFSAIAQLCQTPWGLENYSPFAKHKYLLLDMEGAEDHLDVSGMEQLANRLRLLPCPVIAVGAVAATALLRGIDVVVATLQDAATMIYNINQHPLAAMTLVQLLRHNEDIDPLQGLFAESLAYATLQGGVEYSRIMKAADIVATAVQEPASAVLVERRHDALAVTLNRPHVRNAYSTAMRDGLYDALQLLKADSSLNKAVIKGEGSCFCIGGDLNEFGWVSDPATAHAIRSSRSVGQALLELSAQLEFRLHRACIGSGIELPAFAARVVANKNTFMQLPEIRLGLLPGAGGTVSIPRRIGRHRTAYLALSARKIKASTALKWGLIDAIV